MKRMFDSVQKWFFTGLLVWVPFVATCYLFYIVFEFLDKPLRDYAGFPGLGVALLLLATLLLGAMVSNFVGRRLVRLFDALVSRIPAVNVVYRFIKDFTNTFLDRDKGAFKEVVALQHPREGIWAVGFVTGPAPRQIAVVDSEEMVLVFLMQAFSPAAGSLVAVPRRMLTHIDMTVEEALKLILTGGIVKAPQQAAIAGEQQAPVAALQ
jgi:uncharacterized membrane protein